MVAVFGGFAAGNLVMFQQLGFGLAVAVLLDATVVLCVLVPAAMCLLGAANWWLPRWLNWLPDLRLEAGDHPVVSHHPATGGAASGWANTSATDPGVGPVSRREAMPIPGPTASPVLTPVTETD